MGYKGFIRIVEVVILSFILFALVIPSFFRFTSKGDLSEASNLILCNDLLYSIEINKTFDDVLITDPFTDGINIPEEHEKDIDLLRNITENVFPASIDFDYEIKNVAPYKVSIGCNCTQAQINWLKQKILTPSYPTAEFSIEPQPLSNFSLAKDNLFIIFGEKDLSPYKSTIIAGLREGEGLVLIRNFSSSPDSFTKELFDISYSPSGSTSADLSFNNLSSIQTARIAKRFINNLIRINASLPGKKGKLYLRNKEYNVSISGTCVNISSCSSCLREGESCVIPGIANITLYQIDPLNKAWIDIKISGIANPRNYIFKDSFPETIKKTNSTILSHGNYAASNARILESYSTSYEREPRVFWIYDYDKKNDDLNLLLKTGIIWASGEHFFIFNKNLPNNVKYCIHYYSGLRGNNIPFIAKLIYWGY